VKLYKVTIVVQVHNLDQLITYEDNEIFVVSEDIVTVSKKYKHAKSISEEIPSVVILEKVICND